MAARRRRILRVLTRPNVGGPTRQVLALQPALQELGYDTVLAVGRCGREELEVDVTGSGLRRLDYDECRSGWPDGGGIVRLDGLRRGLSPRHDRAAGRDLRELVRALAPDVVHTHTSKAGWLGRRAALRVRGTASSPVLAHTYHGHVLADYYARWPTAMFRWLERWAARRTDLLFAVSPSCREELAALGVARNCALTPPAVDLTSFARAAADGHRDPGRSLRVGLVGRLVPIKRPTHFVDLIGALRRTGCDVVGEVFGDGELRPQLERTAAGLGEGTIQFHGSLPELAEPMARLDLLVFTSVREGWPVAAIEAMAAGVPVCGYDVPGVRDALVGIDEALLAPAGSVGALVQIVQRLQRDPTWRAMVVQAGREQARQHRPEAIAALLAAEYERGLQVRGALEHEEAG